MQDTFDFAHQPPGLAHGAEFMRALEHARGSVSAERWRAFCERHPGLKRWRVFLAQDPYTREALLGPKGGFKVMDYAYHHASIHAEVTGATPDGRDIYHQLTYASAQSESARQRVGFIADALDLIQPRHVISAASGACRELLRLHPRTVGQLERFTAIDIDRDALAAIEEPVPALAKLVRVQGNVLRPVEAGPPAEVVYSMGLFDYLRDEAAVQVLRQLASWTAPGGVLYVGELAPTAASLGYCEAVLDWWMVTRTRCELIELASAVVGSRWTVSVAQRGCFNYLVLERPLSATARVADAVPASP
jgi:extracellular factor (EF) 3-hydroxypalmitic acid methyl ester biosynthesis protein